MTPRRTCDASPIWPHAPLTSCHARRFHRMFAHSTRHSVRRQRGGAGSKANSRQRSLSIRILRHPPTTAACRSRSSFQQRQPPTLKTVYSSTRLRCTSTTRATRSHTIPVTPLGPLSIFSRSLRRHRQPHRDYIRFTGRSLRGHATRLPQPPQLRVSLAPHWRGCPPCQARNRQRGAAGSMLITGAVRYLMKTIHRFGHSWRLDLPRLSGLRPPIARHRLLRPLSQYFRSPSQRRVEVPSVSRRLPSALRMQSRLCVTVLRRRQRHANNRSGRFEMASSRPRNILGHSSRRLRG
jgi:hypothetical protein